MVGLRLKPISWLNLRVETMMDYIPSGFGDEGNTYLGAPGRPVAPLRRRWLRPLDRHDRHPPTSANLAPGGTQTFTADATYCGKPDAVVYRLSGPGIDRLADRPLHRRLAKALRR